MEVLSTRAPDGARVLRVNKVCYGLYRVFLRAPVKVLGLDWPVYEETMCLVSIDGVVTRLSTFYVCDIPLPGGALFLHLETPSPFLVQRYVLEIQSMYHDISVFSGAPVDVPEEVRRALEGINGEIVEVRYSGPCYKVLVEGPAPSLADKSRGFRVGTLEVYHVDALTGGRRLERRFYFFEIFFEIEDCGQKIRVIADRAHKLLYRLAFFRNLFLLGYGWFKKELTGPVISRAEHAAE